MIAFCDEFEESLFLPHLENCKSARWDEYAVDIMLQDSDKSKGVMSVLDYYGLKPEEAMSLGDGQNDVEMLSYTGIGVAVGRADPAAKKAADYITDDIDDDGWAKAFIHYGLID
jgi:hydroxymethylpyrimidine pyrophosphatase-like HAD family hydrolase